MANRFLVPSSAFTRIDKSFATQFRAPIKHTLTSDDLTLDDFPFVARLEAENASRHLIIPSGNAQLDGDWAVSLDGNGDYLSVSDSADWDLGLTPATVEAYVKFDSFPNIPSEGDEFRIIGEGLGVSGNGPFYSGWSLVYDHTNSKLFFKSYDGVGYDKFVSWSASVGVFYHIAVCRNGNNLMFFVNGIQIGTTQNVSGVDYSRNTSNGIQIGIFKYGSAPQTSYLDGSISRIHVSKGISRYTGNFTPPVRTEPIITDEYTVLALEFDGISTSTRIVDSANPDNATAPVLLPDTGGNDTDANPQNSPLYYSVGGPKLVLDGVNKYLTATLVQSQPFTVYMVADVAADTVAQTLFGDANAFIQLTADEYLLANAGTPLSDTIDHSGTRHVFAAVFNGASAELLVDGVSVASGNVGAGALAAFGIGARNDGNSPAAMDFYALFITNTTFSNLLNSVIMDKY